MVLKIYFGDKPFFLCDEITAEIKNMRDKPDTFFAEDLKNEKIEDSLGEIEKSNVGAVILFTHDFLSSKQLLWDQFTVIQAGGGLVENENQEILMIYRRGKWDLPKGKLDEGETLEECAVREVKEETGLKNIQLLNFLVTTYHTYHAFNQFILKETYWYRMRTISAQKLTPQTEEDIVQIEWVKPEGMPEKLIHTYPSIRDVLG